MSQDVNSDWQNRTFVEGIEMAMRKCVDFLSDFHEQAKFRLSEVDQRLTSLERKVDFVEAQLANADPTQRNAKPKSFEGSTFDPQVRREQVKKFRERLHKTEKVFSDRVIAPKKADGKGGKLIVNSAANAGKKSGPTEIIGAPKIQGKGNIPIKQLQKQKSESKEMEKPKPKPIAVGGPGGNPPGGAKSPPKSPPKQPGGGGPGGAGPGGMGGPGSPNRPPPSAAQAQAAMAAKKMGGPGPGGPGAGPGGAPGGMGGPGAGPGGPPAVPKPPGPPAVPQPPKPQQQPPKQPPVPKPPQQPGSGEGEGTYPTDGNPGGGDAFPHGDPNSIDLLIIKPGDGNVPGGKSKVEIKYTGFLADGSKFIEHQEIISLGLKQNIKGLEAGVQRMQEGTFAKLWIPSKLGYGVRGAPPLIPQNADLTFEITVLRIVD